MLVLSVMEPRLRADFETGEYLRSRPNSWKVTSGPGIVRKVSTLATGLSPRWNFQRCLKNMFVCELRGNVLSRRVSLTAKYVDTHRHRLVRLFIVPQLTMIGHFKRATSQFWGMWVWCEYVQRAQHATAVASAQSPSSPEYNNRAVSTQLHSAADYKRDSKGAAAKGEILQWGGVMTMPLQLVVALFFVAQALGQPSQTQPSLHSSPSLNRWIIN